MDRASGVEQHGRAFCEVLACAAPSAHQWAEPCLPASAPLCLCHRGAKVPAATPPMPLLPQAQAAVDDRFLADLSQLRRRWKLRRHAGAGPGAGASRGDVAWAAPATCMKLCSLLVPTHPWSTCPALQPAFSMLTSHCRCGAPWRGRRPKKAPSVTSFRSAGCACGISLVCCKPTAGVFSGACNHGRKCGSHAGEKGALLKIASCWSHAEGNPSLAAVPANRTQTATPALLRPQLRAASGRPCAAGGTFMQC